MMGFTEDQATSDVYNELWDTLADIAETQGATVSSPVKKTLEGDIKYDIFEQYGDSLVVQIDNTGNNHPGKFEFTAFSPSPPKETKSTTWTYSKKLKKLYVRMAAVCPVNFTTKDAPSGCTIRATPVFLKPHHSKENVTRCPSHSSSREFNDNHPAPSHLVRCDHRLAKYSEDVFGRHSVTIPFEKPQVGCDFTTILYQFMCLGSCVGGPNRRPLQIVFTLEKDDVVYGNFSYEVRICACPGRDRRAEESATLTKCKPFQKTAVRRNALPKMATGNVENLNMSEFELSVRGEENFRLLCKIRDALEIASMMRQKQYQLEENQLKTSILDSIHIASSHDGHAQATGCSSTVDLLKGCSYNSSTVAPPKARMKNVLATPDLSGSSLDNIEPSISTDFSWKTQTESTIFNTQHAIFCQYSYAQRNETTAKRRKY